MIGSRANARQGVQQAQKLSVSARIFTWGPDCCGNRRQAVGNFRLKSNILVDRVFATNLLLQQWNKNDAHYVKIHFTSFMFPENKQEKQSVPPAHRWTHWTDTIRDHEDR